MANERWPAGSVHSVDPQGKDMEWAFDTLLKKVYNLKLVNYFHFILLDCSWWWLTKHGEWNHKRGELLHMTCNTFFHSIGSFTLLIVSFAYLVIFNASHLYLARSREERTHRSDHILFLFSSSLTCPYSFFAMAFHHSLYSLYSCGL
jgi:hypothetical protein